MDKEIKIKWTEALLSGEYSQGKAALKIGNHFCCLGVLCDIHRKETNNGEWSSSIKSEYTVKDGIADSAKVGVLPPDVVKWAGLNDENPPVSDGYLARLNDNGYTFEKLAELIEKDL